MSVTGAARLRQPRRTGWLPSTRSVGLAVGVVVCGAAATGCAGDDPARPNGGDGELPVALERVAQGLDRPTDFQTPPGDSRSFILEQPGTIRILRGDALAPQPFLDISDRVRSGGEEGLLGLAFPANFSDSRRFFVHYTDRQGNTTVSRFGVTMDPDVADPSSEAVYLSLPQPFANHNGGQISFGPDGMLYIALGDGGSANDPLGSGQNTGTLLGSLLRVDVSRDPPYRVPPDNPFVGDPGARDEIWAYGLRNPWKFSFDAGFLFIADVGQNRWEEINTAPSDLGGRNFGWALLEGDECVRSGCDPAGTTLPTLSYPHSDGCSVTGGYVYRGERVTALRGYYLYGDYCAGWIRAFRLVGRDFEDDRELPLEPIRNITSFGLDAAGELYVLSQDGDVFRLVSSS